MTPLAGGKRQFVLEIWYTHTHTCTDPRAPCWLAPKTALTFHRWEMFCTVFR